MKLEFRISQCISAFEEKIMMLMAYIFSYEINYTKVVCNHCKVPCCLWHPTQSGWNVSSPISTKLLTFCYEFCQVSMSGITSVSKVGRVPLVKRRDLRQVSKNTTCCLDVDKQPWLTGRSNPASRRQEACREQPIRTFGTLLTLCVANPQSYNFSNCRVTTL